MTPSQAAQEKPTSPRPDRCDWIEVGQPYPNECGRTLPCDRHGGDAEGHPFGFVNLARQHAEGTVAALQAAGFSDDDMVRFLDAVEASGLTLIPREAAGKDSPATPSLDALRYALGLVKRIHSASEEWTKYDEDTPGDAEQAIQRIGKSVRAELGLVIEALSRLDEGSKDSGRPNEVAASATPPRIHEVVGQGDGTMIVTLDDGTERRITEQEYLDWPRDEGPAT